MKAIHQLVPRLGYGDAICDDVFAIRKMLREWGYESAIYTGDWDEEVAAECLPFRKHRRVSSRENGVILHHAIGSRVSDYIKSVGDKKMLIYHNITPPHFFSAYADTLRKKLEHGRKQLKRLRKAFDISVGDSEYNADELRALGYKNVHVLPIILDFEKYEAPPCPFTMSRFDHELTSILYLGRIAPNKKVEDVLRAFGSYQRRINPQSRLILVGRVNRFDNYHSFLMDLAEELKISNFWFTGGVSFDKLIAFYHMADLFILMSEHEGFGVPLLEAMFYEVPILAYKSTAVPETLGKAGILVVEKNYDHIAEMMHLILTDDALRAQIIQTQKERLKDYEWGRIEGRLRNIIQELEQC